MPINVKIWVALAITVVAIVGALWQIANIRGMKSRGRRRTPSVPDRASAAQRRGDSRALSGPEKRLYIESQKLLAQGKTVSAARILEQLGMQREAIQVLEDHGMIHDAAKILMRLQRANRAGVVYARHGMWENAAQCFRIANMPLEVAKCAREAGDLKTAAEFFEKVGRFEDAGECYEQLGDFHHAARIFSQVGQRGKAMIMYDRLAGAVENLQAIQFEESELQQIVDYLGDGHMESGLADVVVSRNKLTDVILNLVSKGMGRQASELFLRATSDIGPMLMAEVNYQNRSAACLAEVFVTVANFHYAGMIYERMNAFEDAGAAFEKAEDFERAAYCFERAGADARVRVLKEKAKHSPYRGGRAGPSGFALANVTITDDSQNFGSEDSTAVINTRRPSMPPPPRAVPAGNFSLSAEDETGEKDEAARGNVLPPAPPARHPPWDEPEARKPPAAPFTTADADDDDEDDDDEGSDEDNVETENPRMPPPAPPVPADEDGPAPAPTLRPVVAAATEDDTADEESTAAPEVPPAPPAHRLPAEPPVRLEEGRAAFHKAQFFADLDFEQKNKLWSIGVTLSFDAEQTVLTYNDEPKGVYVIIQGSVSCYKQVGGKEAYVDQMGEAESFGELWLLADQPTAVRFVATRDTKIRVIERGAFDDLLDKDGTIARKVYKRFTMRLLKRLLRPQNQRINQAAS